MRARAAVLFLCVSFLLYRPGHAAEEPLQQVPESSQPPVVDAEHHPQVPPQAVIPSETFAAFDAARQQNADMLDVLYQVMKLNADGKWEGVTYALTTDNALPNDWLLQTPKVWGKPAADVKPGAGLYVADRVKDLVASAQTFVDITTLTPFPSGAFESAVIAGLQEIAKQGRPVTVRFLAGWYPNAGGTTQSQYLQKIAEAIKKTYPNNKLKIYAGAMRVDLKSWNHAKIVAVDGQRSMVGGQNLWDSDYLQLYPAHDLSVAVNGSAAFHMHSFADKLWESVCHYTGSWAPAYWPGATHNVTTGCLAQSGVPKKPGPGNLRVLGAGRLGDLVQDGNAADAAMVLSFYASAKTIRIAQQDLGQSTGVTWLFWDAGMTQIARALVRKQDVYIVLSSDHAQAGFPGATYWNGIPLTGTADRLKDYVAKQPGAPTGKALNDLLCRYLHLAPIRFGASDQWPNGFRFANHSKFWMVDDRFFYVGSENLYPSDLQEYGVILNDATAVKKMKEDYWDKLWSYSKRAAISGSEASRCHFQK